MTEPMPEFGELLRRLRIRALCDPDQKTRDEAREAADALAAVTAERDQARDQNAATTRTLHRAWGDLGAALENARALQQMHEQARLLLDQTLTERDAVQADNHKIAEMYRTVVNQLADAPHGWACDFNVVPGLDRVPDDAECTCWKAGL